jgi:5,5'-dehydrodivanillate O-demethylase oxygenase subunit
MLSKEENERLTRVGPGTPCGELMRRYWWPIALADDVAGRRPKRVRLLGEDYVLFRDGTGQLGLLEPLCAHRRTALANGRVEANGVRCCYHGWLFAADGRCLEQPAERPENTFKDRVRLTSYPTQEVAGLVWAYVGPAPAPLLPKWDLLFRDDGRKHAWGFMEYCNWLQSYENACDMTHLNWLHAAAYPAYAAQHPDIVWERFPYGLTYTVRDPNLPAENLGQQLFPTITRFASARVEQGPRQNLIWRVPVDDTHTLNLLLTFWPDDQPMGPLPVRWKDNQPGVYDEQDDDWWGVESMDQDRMAVEGQGPITDRSIEHLAASDRGVTMYRELLREAITAVEGDRDPMNVFRDPADDRIVELDTHMFAFTPPLKPLAGVS